MTLASCGWSGRSRDKHDPALFSYRSCSRHKMAQKEDDRDTAGEERKGKASSESRLLSGPGALVSVGCQPGLAWPGPATQGPLLPRHRRPLEGLIRYRQWGGHLEEEFSLELNVERQGYRNRCYRWEKTTAEASGRFRGWKGRQWGRGQCHIE